MAGISAGTVYVDVKPNTQTLGKNIESGSRSAFTKLAGVVAGAFVATKIVQFGATLVHAAEDAAAANRKSLALISGDADAAFVHFDALTSWAEDFGNSIGADDEAITNLAAKITQSFDLNKLFGAGGAQAGLEQITASIVDMSAATDKPQKMLTKLFQTIANDPGAALTTLKKLGAITDEQAEHFQKMIDNGKGAAVSTELLDTVSKKYAGSAKAGSTSSERLGAVFDNLNEAMGSFLLPLFEGLAGILSTVFGALESGNPIALALVGIIGALVAVILIYNTYTKIAAALQGIWNAVMAANPIGLIVVAIALLVAGIVLFFTKTKIGIRVFQVLKAVGVAVFHAIKTALTIWFNVYKTVFTTIWNIARTVWNNVKGLIIGVWGAVKNAWNGAKAFFRGVWDAILATVRVFWNAFAALWNNTIGKIGIHFNHFGINIDFDVPDLPTLKMGGTVLQTGLAVVHEGETFSGVGGQSWMPRTIEIVDSNLGLVMTGVVREDHDFDGRMARMRR